MESSSRRSGNVSISEDKWTWDSQRESKVLDDEELSKIDKESEKKLSQYSVDWDKKSFSGSEGKENWYKVEEEEPRKINGEKTVKMGTSHHVSTVSAVEKRMSQWEELMRKFSEAHKEECKAMSVDIPRAPRSAKQFPTGSQYEGTWDVLGMSGFGTYTFPSGVIYEGEFDDGMFHGTGELRYPCGAVLRGIWNKGVMTDRTLTFAEGLEYSEEDWLYCRHPDRRFTIEYENGLQPLGKTYLTAEQPTREIPAGYYDTGDGFYDPKTRIVYKADDLNAIVRSPCPFEQKWILENCRSSVDESLGPRPELYEEWSEPQIDPLPPPPPAAASRAYTSRKSELYDDDKDVVMRLKKKSFYIMSQDDTDSTSSVSSSESVALS